MRAALVALALSACGEAAPASAPEPPSRPAPSASSSPATITIVGTSDLHGHLERVPLLAGYVRVLRDLREGDGGVVLVDGGDLFQGTLESNLAEGAPVVSAYEALAYDAVTIGNHEFDFGPVGERTTPASPTDDPRGALRARIAEADFAVLSANAVLASGAPMGIGERPSVVIERAGVRIGLVGVTTESTLRTTMSANVADLRIEPLASTIAAEAARLRDGGASVVVVLAHAGGRCDRFDDPHDLSSCRPDEEIFEVARALPAGAVDVIVAGHTHQAVAQIVNGIAIVQSYAYGRAFGRVDLRLEGSRVSGVVVHPPRDLCSGPLPDGADPSTCAREPYEGREVVADPAVDALLAPARERARERRDERLGPDVTGVVHHSREAECALGNLLTDLMRAARPSADVAVINGGGLRADIPAGPLTYGAVFTAFPFDNRFAAIRMSGSELAEMLAANAGRDGSFLSISGVRARIECDGDRRVARLVREDGTAVTPDAALTVLASDFMATGGDDFFRELLERDPARATIEEEETIRDAVAGVLRRRGETTLDPDVLFDPAHRRVDVSGGRPLRCD